MSFVILLVGAGVLASFCACAWHRHRLAPQRAANGERIRTPRPIQVPTVPRKPGCMINAGPTGCRAARRIEAAWYPQEQVPRLPLDTCESPTQCRCTWMRVIDRRVTQQPVETERRIGRPGTRSRRP